jgi:hypothetical protein
MRSILRTAVILAASLLLVPQFVAAADLGSEIQDMKQRLEAMESQLQTQSAELTDARAMVAAQQTQLDETQTLVNDEREATSALSSFLESTDISGFVAAGWNRTDLDTKRDRDSSSSFNLDQAWITINKAATAESRAGFNIELQMGQDTPSSGAGNQSVGLYAASVSYLAPLGNGLEVEGGIMSTALGAEVEAQNGNWQINRGAVFALQPVTSTGFTATYGITDNISVMMGVLNDAFAPDFNNGRPRTPGQPADTLGLTSQVSYSQDKLGVNVGFNYGGGAGSGGNFCTVLTGVAGVVIPGGCLAAVNAAGVDRSGIMDVVVTLDPMDKLSLWVNYDYTYSNDAAGNSLFGVNALAFAGRFAVLDSTGISGRFEYLSASAGNPSVDVGSLKTYTVTLDHELTAGLTAKFEYEHTTLSPEGGTDGSANQMNLQMLYEF